VVRLLVVGASGATGRRVVRLMLKHGHHVIAMLRPGATPPPEQFHPRLTVEYASLLDLGPSQLAGYVRDCDAVVSCLGHTPTFAGIFGQPRRLVTTATARLCAAIGQSGQGQHTRLILMNSAGTLDPGEGEAHTLMERGLAGALRLLLPPYLDNVTAASYLRNEASRNDAGIEWAVVRPDSLHDGDSADGYAVHASPVRSAFFNPGKVSRINVARFICALASDEQAWRRWRRRMPVVYDR
jgi:putative NADH-flavin reductase